MTNPIIVKVEYQRTLEPGDETCIIQSIGVDAQGYIWEYKQVFTKSTKSWGERYDFKAKFPYHIDRGFWRYV